jgi:hypothetical protein
VRFAFTATPEPIAGRCTGWRYRSPSASSTGRDVNRTLPPSGLIALEYSLAENMVKFTARQSSSYAAFATTLGEPGNGIQLFNGAATYHTGGAWQWNSLLPKLPGGPGGPSMADLGWENRVILTPSAFYSDKGVVKPSENPVPPETT